MDGVFLPVVLVIAIASVVPSWTPGAQLRTRLLVGAFLLLLLRYLWWRITVTVIPGSTPDIEGVVIWSVFLAEMLLWTETALLVVILSRRTDRRSQATNLEKTLRKLDAEALPHVDVLIATVNEPLDVLEKTIAGALALDWPAGHLHVYVLDDGKRDWLASYCSERGVAHLVRDGNAHAKAGNINAAIARTDSPFVLVLDADFVPQRPMLMRAIGFFNDPKVGIVQMPHYFFNNDPVQTNLNMRRNLPDEQRFFFDVIQPGRDGWNCAFCCGSNGIIRRSALDDIGGRIPTDSITEDMLLSLEFLRKGYITRYLGDRLAIGLAPENLNAYYIQRERWARGAIQILFLRSGPFGPGLRLIERMQFLPSHWISQSICQPIAIATPAFFLLTGIPPLIDASVDGIFYYQLPVVVGGLAIMKFFAPDKFAPLSATVQSVMQAFRILPVVAWTLVRPDGHSFKVTPKGSDAGDQREDRFTILIALTLLIATGAGLFLNANFETRIVEEGQLLPVVAFWAVVNMVILLLAITISIPRPIPRTEERFATDEICRLHTRDGVHVAEVKNISLSGTLIAASSYNFPALRLEGDWVGLELAGAGIVPAHVERKFDEDGQALIGVAFWLPPGQQRDALIQKLFTSGLKTVVSEPPSMLTGLRMLGRIVGRVDRPDKSYDTVLLDCPPDWILKRCKFRNDKSPGLLEVS